MISVHRTLVLAATILGGAAAASDSTGPDQITAVSLAERIRAGERLRLFDLRGEEDFRRFHVPSAEHATLAEIMDRRLPRSASIVLYAADGVDAAHARAVLRARGYRHVAYLRDGLYEWITRVHEPLLAVDATTAERGEFERLAALSRYFGGQPRLDVPRTEIPPGHWTAGRDESWRPSVSASLLVAAIRRRGC